MADNPFKVVFKGNLRPGFDEATVKENLATLFNRDIESISRLFTGKEVVIRGDLDERTARIFQNQIMKCGAECEIQGPGAAAPAAPTRQMSCPHCNKKLKIKGNAAGKKVKCPACGQAFAVTGAPPPVTGEQSKPDMPPPPPIAGESPPPPPSESPPAPSGADSPPEMPQPQSAVPVPVPLPEQTPPADKKISKKNRMEGLSTEARKVVEQKSVSGQKRIRDWFRLLREISTFDEGTDTLVKRSSNIGCLFIVLFILLGVGFFFLLDNFNSLAIASAVMAVGCLATGIVFYVRRSHFKKMDLHNEFRYVLVPFLQAISEDIHPKGKVSLTLDMAGITDAKIKKKGNIPPGRFRKVIETIIHDPWCHLEIPLAEGSRLVLDIENQFTTHERHWRNPRGKSKSKVKWKKLVIIKAGLMPNQNVLDFNENKTDALAGREKLKLAEKKGKQLAVITKKYKFKEENMEPEASITEEDLLELFFQLGMAVHPG